MKNIISIIKKEFARFFKDKRMVISTLILPAVMIYVMYSFMGDGMTSMLMPDDSHTYTVYVYNQSDVCKNVFENMAGEEFNVNIFTNGMEEKSEDHLTVTHTDLTTEESKDLVKDKNADIVIVFPTDFDAKLLSGEKVDGNNVEMYYDSTDKYSSNAFTIYSSVMQTIEDSLINKFDINLPLEGKTYDMASEKEKTGQFFSMMLPMLLIVFLFSGCMSVAPESIAGEKERGTIATMLVTPIKRSELAIGKIVSLSVIGLLSGLSSFIGTMLSLPKMMGDAAELNANVYGLKDYFYILAVIVVTILMLTALIAIISAFSKSVKEASTYLAPLMIIVTILGISSMMFQGGEVNTALYFIPIFNSIQVFNAIFSFKFSVINFVITIISNIVVSGVLIYVLTRMFNSEKVMFNK